MKPGQLETLERIAQAINEHKGGDPAKSYVAKLFQQGDDAMLKKIGEEATEVVLAAKGDTDERLAEEAADLVFHLSVALHERGVPFERVLEVLARRRK